MPKPKIASLINPSLAPSVLGDDARKRLASFAELAGIEQDGPSKEQLKAILADADGCITSWGTPALDEEILAAAPKLKIMAHAAGTVKHLVFDALFDRGVVVTSASAAIAVDVAQTTLGLIICGLKRIFDYNRITHSGGWRTSPLPAWDVEGSTVGIIGASHVGKRTIELLKPFDVNVLLYDPYCSEEKAAALGVKKASLEDVMSKSHVVSLHAPITEETKGMIKREHFAMMQDGATFINTARGIIIDEQGLIDELKRERIYACLDVTYPEPPEDDSPLRSLENCILTPHIAGCVGRARLNLGEYAVEEIYRFFHNQPQRYPVTKEMLPRIG